MFLTLFIIFLILSLVLIALGLFRNEHSELALLGFVFMFFLGMVIILGGDIQYKTGVNTSYTCLCCDNSQEQQRFGTNVVPCDGDNATIVPTSSVDIYSTWESGTAGHFMGYWLAVISIIGFTGVIMGLGRNKL